MVYNVPTTANHAAPFPGHDEGREEGGHTKLYRMVLKKCPKLCVTITARILYREIFVCTFVDGILRNFSDAINDVTECCLMK